MRAPQLAAVEKWLLSLYILLVRACNAISRWINIDSRLHSAQFGVDPGRRELHFGIVPTDN